jgi:UDP-3-O-[3-hydroxymyristoyl] glucosamine N-acyltransferase
MKYSLKEIADHIHAQLVAPAAAHSLVISGVASLGSAGASDLVFVEDARHLGAALASKAGAVIVAGPSADRGAGKALLLHDHPRLAFARAAALLAEPPAATMGVHPSAVVHPQAVLGLGASVGAHAVVGEGAVIGARTRIGPNCHIAARVGIGGDCVIEGNVTVYSGSRLGHRVHVHSGAVLGSDGFGFVRDPASGRYEKFPQVGRLEIGNDVEIGANCTIDRGALDATSLADGVKLDNLVHIGHNVRIGENVVIAAQTGISGSSVIERDAVIAGQVGIADHVTIGEGVILGAQCGVPSGKILRGKGILFWGTPARPIKGYLKELAALSRLAKK